MKPYWLDLAYKELGVRETPGEKTSPRIREYLDTVTGGEKLTDEDAWCSAAMNYVIERSGMEGTDSAAAVSWNRWGRKLSGPKVGCLVVLWRVHPDDWRSYVGFVVDVDFDKKRIKVYGANQQDPWCEQWFPMHRVRSYRWPRLANNLKAVYQRNVAPGEPRYIMAVKAPAGILNVMSSDSVGEKIETNIPVWKRDKVQNAFLDGILLAGEVMYLFPGWLVIGRAVTVVCMTIKMVIEKNDIEKQNKKRRALSIVLKQFLVAIWNRLKRSK